jgi:hypothetical protein
MNNPYKKEYKQSYKESHSNTMNTRKSLLQDKPDKQHKPHNPYKSYSKQNIFKCKKCKVVFSSYVALEKHSYIHINPVYCHFPKCGKVFSPKHTYQYRQHIDSHNGGLNIKCKFCDHRSRSLSANTNHMKLQHTEEYSLYKQKINDYNDDIKSLDATRITHLTTKYINTAFFKSRAKKQDNEQDDPELTYIENNKYYDKDYDNHNEINNLDLFADIAISYSYIKC